VLCCLRTLLSSVQTRSEWLLEPLDSSQYSDFVIKSAEYGIGILNFIESGQFSDFTIKCGDYEWKVHKFIITAECGYFRRLCSSNFKVSISDLSREA